MPEKYCVRDVARARLAATGRRAARLRPRVARRADLVEALGDGAVADHERLDLGDSARLLDAEPRDEHRRLVAFADRAHEHGLAALDVGELQRVAAAAGRRVPQAVVEVQALAVLGELHVARERQARRVVGDDGFDVHVEKALRGTRDRSRAIVRRPRPSRGGPRPCAAAAL